jgi:hypothetical protein
MNDESFTDTPDEEVARQLAAARQEQRELSAALAVAERSVSAIRQRLHATALTLARGTRVLSARDAGGNPAGDILADLSRLADRISGGAIRSLTTDDQGRGSVEVVDRDGRTWRVTFTGPAEAFRADAGYELAADEAAIGATVSDALWDESWLISASQGDRDIHIRLSGDPIRVEEVG